MGKRKPPECSEPSKAYLVSFGDTMTALLAFFIVLNSLAKEQTGANMYAGTGSFVNAFASSGMPGGFSGDRSRDVIQQESQKPIYALRENMEESTDKVGPDDTEKNDRVKNRDAEQFQKFLTEMENKFGLRDLPSSTNQIAFDSFQRFDPETGALSKHAIQLLSESIAKLRKTRSTVEVIVWATVPSKTNLELHVNKTAELRAQVEKMFWLKPTEKTRIRYRAKPWLFADAKRPVLTVVYSTLGE